MDIYFSNILFLFQELLREIEKKKEYWIRDHSEEKKIKRN